MQTPDFELLTNQRSSRVKFYYNRSSSRTALTWTRPRTESNEISLNLLLQGYFLLLQGYLWLSYAQCFVAGILSTSWRKERQIWRSVWKRLTGDLSYNLDPKLHLMTKCMNYNVYFRQTFDLVDADESGSLDRWKHILLCNCIIANWVWWVYEGMGWISV